MNRTKIKQDCRAKLAMARQFGQSMGEVVFAIGIVALVITGAVVLILNSLGSQAKRFDHKKATEMGQQVMEDLVSQKNNNPNNFWRLQDISTPLEWAGFDDYTYTIDFQQETTGARCTVSPIRCATATITIMWERDTSKNLILTRYFSRL